MALKGEITEQIKELLRQNPNGLSITAIVRQIPINRNTAGRYLENLMVSGQVEMRHFGMAKIYSLAQRVPLAAMLSISSELIMLVDTGRRVIYANGPMLDFLATTQKELYGKAVEFTPCVTVFNDTFEHLKKRIGNGIAGKEWSGEIVAKNGTVIFACRIAPAVFEEGQRGVSILLENITERRGAERMIEESEREFRLLAENTLDIINRHTPDGVFLYVSPAITAIAGYEPTDLIGKRAYAFLHHDDIPQVERAMRNLDAKNPVVQLTYRARHRDGHYLWVESRFRAIVDGDTGQVVEVYGITRDISGRVLAEQALRESEDRYRTLVEISPDAILLHQDGRIVYLNPAACRLIGVSSLEELSSVGILDIISPGYREVVRENIERDIDGRPTPLVELPIVRRDGTEVIIEGKGVGTVVNGKPAVQVTLRDITERKKAEDTLRESRQRLVASQRIAKMGDLTWNLETGEIIWSDGMYALLGFDRGETVDMARVYAQNHHPEDRERVNTWLNDSIRSGSGRIPENEYRVIRKDGTVLFVHAEGEVQYAEGKPVKVFLTLQDITGRKLAEQDIRQARDMFRTFIDHSYDAVIIHDTKGGILNVNETMLTMYRLTREEALSLTIEDITGPACRREDVGARWGEALAGKDQFFSWQARRPRDGSLFDVEVYLTRVTIGDRPVILANVRDVTERRRAQAALKESENRYRTLAEVSSDIIFLIDRDDRVMYANSAAAALVGIPADQLVGTQRSLHFSGRHEEYQAERLRRVFDTGQGIREESASEIAGILHWFDHSLTPVRDADGRITAVLGSSRDITDRKRTEEALAKSERRFHELADLLPQNVWECDITGRLTFANRHSFEMYRYSPEDIRKGLSVWQMIHPDDRQRLFGIFTEALKHSPEEFPTQHEYTAIRSDGSTFPVMMYLVPIITDNRITGMRGIGIDLSEQKRIGDALRESARAFQALAENSVDVISRIRPDGTLIYVSPAVRHCLGYVPEEITGAGGFKFFHPDDLPHVRSIMRSFADLGIETGTDRFRMMHRNGSSVWFEATIRATRDEKTGQITEFTVVSRLIPAPGDMQPRS